MKRSTWLRNTLRIALLALLVFTGAGFFALRSYLASAGAAQQVADRLQQMLGGRVEIQSAQIGLIGNSTVRGIEVYEDDKAGKPWLRIDDVNADVSAVSVLRGKSPEDIRLQGARLFLRFDSQGRLLTKLPARKEGAAERLPNLQIEKGELTFNQEHRSPMIIRGVHAEISSSENGLKLTGDISDPFWGNWQASGAFDNNGSQGSITLDTESVTVTMTKLRAIPFVPQSVWQEVSVEGTTPAQVHLDMETKKDKTSVHYRVEIAPQDAHVQVPSIDLDATHAAGKAVIVDEIVQLENIRGKMAGGSITTSGKLNFYDEPTRLAFKVGVQDVFLHQLPRSWKVPNDIDGKLTGSADLVVTIKNGKVDTEGSGAGVIRDASWSGFYIHKPIRLSLHSENGRFHFRQPKLSGSSAVATKVEVQTRANYPEPARNNVPLPLSAPRTEGNKTGDAPKDEDNLLQNAPAEMVNLLSRGIKLAADGMSQGIDYAAQMLGKLKPPSKPGEEPTYLDMDLSLQNVDLAQLVQRLKLNLPYSIAGRLTFQVHASIPINTAGDLKAYRLHGTAHLPSLNVAGLAMTNVATKVRFADGVLELKDLKGQILVAKDASAAGTFDGDARIEVVPSGDLQSSLKLERIPLATILSLVPELKGQVSGVLSGTVKARAPLMKLSDPASWRGEASLNAPSVDVFGVPLRNAIVGLTVDDTRAKLTTLKAELEGAPLTGGGEIQLQGAYPFKAEVHLGRGDLTTLNRLAPAFRPPFQLKGKTEFDGTANGTLKPLQFDTSGKLHARELVVDHFTVDDVSFRWSKDNGDMKLDAIKMELYGGSITGSARLPLTATAPGSAHLDVRNLDVKAMAQALPVVPVRLEGKVSGTAKGKLSPAEADRPRTWTSDIEMTAPQLRVQGIPAEKLKGSIDSRGGKTTYNLQGETLGGTFTLKGDLPAPAKEEGKKQSQKFPEKSSPLVSDASQKRREEVERFCEASLIGYVADEPGASGRFELRNARLSRVWRAYGITGPLASLDGQFSIFLDYRHIGPNLSPIGDGSFRIDNISWYDEFLGSSLQGSARLTASTFELLNVSGDLAGGLFLGRFGFGLRANSRSWFRIDLQQVEASRLFLPIPAVAAHVKGPMDVNLRGRIGRDWEGSGGATLTRGQIYGMDITEWRIPLTFSFSPSQGSGELTIRDSNARIAQGRARFEGTLNWGNGLRLAGLLLFYEVDLRTLLRHTPEVSSYASGRVSGRVDLNGSEMRSINDLTALVQARMRQGQALQMPVLRQITPYLRPGASSATFRSGELKGRLAGGIFRIEHATLVGDFIRMLMLGTITLAGNLNLQVTAQTGLYCLNPSQTNAISSRIPVIGAIPRLVLYEANALLAAAVVHLRVTGTVHAPVIRIQPLVTLTEEAVRFFLGSAFRLGLPDLP